MQNCSKAQSVQLHSKANRSTNIHSFSRHRVSMTRTKYFWIKVSYVISNITHLHTFYASGMTDASSIHFYISESSELSLPDSSLVIDLCTLGFWYSPSPCVSDYYSTQEVPHLSDFNYLVWCKYSKNAPHVYSIRVQRVVSILGRGTQILVESGISSRCNKRNRSSRFLFW